MKGRNIAIAAIGLSIWATAAVASLAYDVLSRSPDESCRVQVLTSEERVRSAIATANATQGDKIAALLKGLGIDK